MMMEKEFSSFELIIYGLILTTFISIFTIIFFNINNNKYDINKDGKVNSQDMYKLKKHIIDENTKFTKEYMLKVQGYIMNYNDLNNDERILFDINDDGIINVQDYVLMKNKVMGDSNENIDK